MQAHVLSLHPQAGSNGQTIFWLKVVMLHIKLKGMECRVTCKHIFCPYTHPQPLDGVKRKNIFFFAESSHVAYQIKGNGTQSNMQAHILSHPDP